ncbi:hypothetical protein ACFW04_008225 [Cataglyphis niger]
MESVLDMLRPMHFVFLFAAFAFLAFTAAEENKEVPPIVQSEVEPQSDVPANDLEADASYWGYGRPWRYGGWGYGRGYGWGGWRGGYWGGPGYWGGRGWGGGWGYWG